MRIGAAVLAAGASRRLGQAKQLLLLPSGRTLLEHAVDQTLATEPTVCAVIVGRLRVAELLRERHVTLVFSPDPEEGIAASIRAATVWADAQQVDALLLSVCDQPLLSARHLAALLRAFRTNHCVAASFYAGKRAVPAVFPRAQFPELYALRGDRGAAAILAAAPKIALVAWPPGELDIDTEADWARVTC